MPGHEHKQENANRYENRDASTHTVPSYGNGGLARIHLLPGMAPLDQVLSIGLDIRYLILFPVQSGVVAKAAFLFSLFIHSDYLPGIKLLHRKNRGNPFLHVISRGKSA